MANKPYRPCSRPGCDALVRGGGYCEKHRPKEPERRASKAWHWMYQTKWWKQERIAQLFREPMCRECRKAGVRTKATEVDHIKPHRGDVKLFKDKMNMQSLCKKCHSKKTAKERYIFHKS